MAGLVLAQSTLIPWIMHKERLKRILWFLKNYSRRLIKSKVSFRRWYYVSFDNHNSVTMTIYSELMLRNSPIAVAMAVCTGPRKLLLNCCHGNKYHSLSKELLFSCLQLFLAIDLCYYLLLITPNKRL